MTLLHAPKTITCSQCKHPFPWTMLTSLDSQPCPHCSTDTWIAAFPAFLKDAPKGENAAAVTSESESTCFYHADRRAAGVCEQCGRFLCALCDIVLAGRHLCTACIASGKRKGRMENLEKTRTLHDTLALALAAIPVVSIATAPMAIYIAIRHWKTPSSLLPRTRIRYTLAIVLAAIQLIFWPLVFIAATRW